MVSDMSARMGSRTLAVAVLDATWDQFLGQFFRQFLGNILAILHQMLCFVINKGNRNIHDTIIRSYTWSIFSYLGR
jgi:hypothetical protein